jgi:hypothetical protein
MGAITSVDYTYRLVRGSRNTKKYKISNKNGENKRTISITKTSIAHACIVAGSQYFRRKKRSDDRKRINEMFQIRRSLIAN